MRRYIKCFLILIGVAALHNEVYAQKTYSIRADSVRIYSGCDTAELILENRTKDTLGFLFNKGKGRTEFRKLRMKIVNGNAIAIEGQDTLQLGAIGKTAVDTIYRLNDSLHYRRTDGRQMSIGLDGTSWITLDSLISKNRFTDDVIIFTTPDGTPSNGGLYWGYNSDFWKIFVEATGDEPPGNMIFESGDNKSEGWIFRNSDYATGIKENILSLGVDRFTYKGNTVIDKSSYDYIRGGAREDAPDWNTMTDLSFIGSVSGNRNAPYDAGSGAWWNIMSIRHRNGAIDGPSYGMQIASGLNYAASAKRMFFRNHITGIWTPWYEIWHSGNMTPATAGANVVLKTDEAGNIIAGTSMKIASDGGLYTDSGARLYKKPGGGWGFRDDKDSIGCSLEFEDKNGVALGSIRTNAAGYIGFGSGNDNRLRLGIDPSGNGMFAGTMTATRVMQTSLRSLKKEIRPYTGHALSILNKSQVRTFVFKADFTNTPAIGFIADELPDEMAAPGKQGVDQSNTVALLVKALQEMSAEVKALQKEIASLKQEVKASKRNK